MILDTNALSAWIDGNPAIEGVLVEAAILRLNSISLGEYRYGILQSRHRLEYENRLALIETDLETLTIDPSTAVLYALMRHELRELGCPIPYHDIWIAALARQHGLPILSRDIHFDSARGVQRVGW
ncbi:MAG TPA: PIN domain-containing protein [Chthoniobacterales bacterium]|jgi:tRNA(fMet)-specific endonuclease VapC|nr:PIN domain-containing protein [Chthoniobacterales bacterium]